MMDQHDRATHPIEEGDLLAFLDGAASPEAAAHIASCPDCLAEAHALGSVSALFGAALDRDDCPEPEQLLEYSVGVGERAERSRMREHIAGCERCRAELAELNGIDDMRAPARSMPRLWSAPDPRAVAGPPRDARRLIALPVAPSEPSYAVRGDERRQLAWEAGDFRIVLSLLVPGVPEQGWRVEGQVSSGSTGDPALVGASVALLADGAAVADDIVDDLGYFALDPMPAGTYALRITSDDESIQIEELLLQ